MSRNRLSIIGAVACGAAAFAGWGLSEMVKGASGRWFSVALTCGLVGGAIGIGLQLVSGLSSGRWRWQLRRIVPGLFVGGLAGAIGGSLGNLFFSTFRIDRSLGWMIMGAGLGAVDGLYDRSKAKLRSGLIGGLTGGLIGGLSFGLVSSLLDPLSRTAARAAAFVVLGAAIGFAVEILRTSFARAWLTVLDGDRPSRRLVLDARTVLIGRADDAALTFRGRAAQGVDEEHARLVRLDDGRYALEDNRSRHGTSVNFKRVLDRVVLEDGDLIRIGVNSIRFRARRQRPGREARPPRNPAPAPTNRPEQATPAQASTPAPRPTAAPTPPGRPGPSGQPTSNAPLPRGMSACPNCRRLVTGTRRHCVICNLTF